jgi:predicted permease
MKYTLRLMRKSPGFTVAAVLTLALGIGANSAIFSLVKSVLLSQLPFEHASRLVWIWATRVDRDKAFYSLPDFVETRESLQAFDGFAAYANWGANLSGAGEAERFNGARISAYAFEMMGVRALHGRTLLADDDRPGSPPIVVLSYGLWQRRFGGDPGVVGKGLTLNGDSYSVAGVLPPEFVMPNTEAELFVPLVIETDPMRNNHYLNFLRVFARLKPNSTRERAGAELASITRRLREKYPNSNGKTTDPRVVAFRDEVTGGYRTSLWMLLGAVGLVLLIACGNIANLLLARALARAREVAIRSALGASRLILIRQFLIESLLLALFGGVLGILLARAGLTALVAIAPADLPRVSEISLDSGVLLFALAISLASGLIFGLAPALHAVRAGAVQELRARGSAGPTGRTARNLLVIAEVALSVVLLICAGLLLKTFVRMQAATPGFEPGHLLLARISLPVSHYNSPVAIRTFYEKVYARLAILPGVRSVALGSVMPLSGASSRHEFVIVGRPPASPLDIPAAQNRWVSAGYFRTLGIPITQGREFNEMDTERSAGVAVIDETLAKRNWPSESPLGQHIKMEGRDFEIVGVAGNVKHNTLTDEPAQTLYVPFAQVTPTPLPAFAGNLTVVLRTAVDPLALAGMIRREIAAADSNVPASSVKTMDQFMAQAISPRRFNMLLVSIFAGAAMLLAGIGLYAVISYSVSMRTNEIGLRMALGAGRSAVVRMILRQAMRVVIAGIAAGLTGAAIAGRVVSSLLFETNAIDPLTFSSVAALFLLVGVIAAYVPAHRAMRVDPLAALRSE